VDVITETIPPTAKADALKNGPANDTSRYSSSETERIGDRPAKRTYDEAQLRAVQSASNTAVSGVQSAEVGEESENLTDVANVENALVNIVTTSVPKGNVASSTQSATDEKRSVSKNVVADGARITADKEIDQSSVEDSRQLPRTKKPDSLQLTNSHSAGEPITDIS